MVFNVMCVSLLSNMSLLAAFLTFCLIPICPQSLNNGHLNKQCSLLELESGILSEIALHEIAQKSSQQHFERNMTVSVVIDL
jgi:hypothetical protein